MEEWGLDPAWLTLNHGSYGAAPRSVLAAQAAWQARLEAQPTRFMMRELTPALREAAGVLAEYLGVDGPGLAFVGNATEGAQAVLRSLRFTAGEEVVVLSHVYGAVRQALRHIAVPQGVRVVEVALPFPRPEPAAVLAALAAALGPRTRLAVLDHITSPSALVLPIAAMVGVCRAAGVPVLVDGAHAPGQVPLDLGAIGAEWYTGNCHKWLLAPKGAGFLWTAPDRRAETHALVVSHGLGQGYAAEFDWTGTRDPSACLAVPAAIAAHGRLGGPALMARNRALALEAGALLAEAWGTEVGALPEMAGSMAMVRLPRPVTRDWLLDRAVDAPVMALGGPWVRVSAQAYNRIEDYTRLAELIRAA